MTPLSRIANPGRGMRFGLWVLACAALLLLDQWQRATPLGSARSVWPLSPEGPPASSLRLAGGGQIPMPANTPAAHASTLLAMPAGHPAALMAFWFAGSRESGPDVQIAAAEFDRASQQWGAARFVVNRHAAGAALGFGLRRLGNPVAWRDASGQIHLFVVATGLGGWAAGRILHLKQSSDRQQVAHLSFAPVRVLPLSWLWNTSHLVRAMPLPLADGGMVLPVYFELGVKYPLALRFDAQGGFRGMVRMSQRGDMLQPTLLMRSETDWLALLRDNTAARSLRMVQTQDGGQHWQALPEPGLPNPDAAIAALALRPGSMLLAHNPRPENRAQLDLSVSPDGLQWVRLLTLARGDDRSEYSYPSLAWADGSLWVSYTDQRRAIAWQRLSFPEAP